MNCNSGDISFLPLWSPVRAAPCRFLTRWQRSSGFGVSKHQRSLHGFSRAEICVWPILHPLDMTKDKHSSGLTKKRCHSKIIKVHLVQNAFLRRFCARPVPALLVNFGADGHTPVSHYTAHTDLYNTIRIHLICSHKPEALHLIHKLTQSAFIAIKSSKKLYKTKICK